VPHQREFNEALFAEVVVYFAKRSQDDPGFGKTKLAKLLAFADFLSFERTGMPLTGATYIKLEWGPAPKELPATLTKLGIGRRVRVREEDSYGYTQTRVIAEDDPDMRALTPDVRALLDEVVERFISWNNSEISALAHRQFVGWQQADEYEAIPYESLYLSPLAPTESEIRRGQQLAAAAARERAM
jgi:hypothetical protein